MTRSLESSHVINLIPEYALELLPVDDANWVAAHLASCGPCRQALAEEKAIAASVKATLSRATMPDRARLQRLMPSTAGPRGRWPLVSPSLAAAGIMLLLVFSTIALLVSQQPGAWGVSPPTAYSTVVVLTDTPTQTATRVVTATAEGLEAFSSPAPTGPSPAAGQIRAPAPALVPVPAAPLFQ